MDARVREEVETAVQALDEALGGLINFMMTLRPTLRNEIMQICGHHLEKARQAKERLEALGRALFNRLQEPAFELEPAVADAYRRVQASGAAGGLMSGSGSCLFALCRNPAEARRVHDDLSRGWASGASSPTRTFLVRSRP